MVRAAPRGLRDRRCATPLRALVEEMDVRLARIAPELVGDPRRSIFRIHRDVRFSADKSPYKTNAACQFYHQDAGRGAGQDAEGAGGGLYFQLADGECFVAGGIWMPARPALDKIREALAADPEALAAIVSAPVFRRRFKRLDEEAMLTRMPRGYAESHPAARWLRYQSFTVTRPLRDGEVTARGCRRRSRGTSPRWCRWCDGSTEPSATARLRRGCDSLAIQRAPHGRGETLGGERLLQERLGQRRNAALQLVRLGVPRHVHDADVWQVRDMCAPSSRPPMSGMTTSVSTRSIRFPLSPATPSASGPFDASSMA